MRSAKAPIISAGVMIANIALEHDEHVLGDAVGGQSVSGVDAGEPELREVADERVARAERQV